MNCMTVEIKKNCSGSELLGFDITVNGKKTFISWQIFRLLLEIKEHDFLFEEVFDELFRIKQRYD